MTEKLRLDIPIVLPGVAEKDDACVSRLIDELRGRDGIEEVHLKSRKDMSAQLCVHFDAEKHSLSRIRNLVESAGARIAEQFGHVAWQAEGIGHVRRARTISRCLQGISGVLEAEVSAAGALRIEFVRKLVDEKSLLLALATLGVTVKTGALKSADDTSKSEKETHEDNNHGHEHDTPGVLGPNTELIFALLSGAMLGIGFAIAKLASDFPSWVSIAFYGLAYLFGGFYTLREAFDNLKLRRFEIDTLMLVAAAGAAAIGAWAEGALLLFLFSIGHALEHYAMGRAKRAIEALAQLAPRTATVRREGKTIDDLPVEQLLVGDVVIVRPNERLPADGFVVLGDSSINQAPVTGESIPVDKIAVPDATAARAAADKLDASSRVFAGTINGEGALEIEVTRLSSDSALAKVVKMVSEAEAQKSPTQRFTEKFERIFVPIVLALAVVLLFAWVLIDEPFKASFYRAMAVLVAASPCALAIATPSAVLSAVARAARSGVLVKGGAPLENLGALEAIAFDKTGTLTEGKPRITDVISGTGVAPEDLLEVAIAVEKLSDHPLAAAIVRDGVERMGSRQIMTASELKSLTGRGVTAQIAGKTVWIGKAEMFGTDDIEPLSEPSLTAVKQLRAIGRTTMVVRYDDRDLGVIGLMDTPREAAQETLARLRQLGIRRMIMLSGDHQKVAEAVGRTVGLDEVWGDLMPEDKVASIDKLRGEAKVAMVGDGVNDAPAMAHATVGIAMGAAGSDVALETADIALMADDLSKLPFAVELSRRARSVILQNTFVSLGVVALLVPATIFGLGIGSAVAIHEGSTLVVVINALRLLGFRSNYKTDLPAQSDVQPAH